MYTAGIYKIINTINGKFYIGRTNRTFLKRWEEHCYDLKNNKHSNIHLQRAFNKYDEKVFKFEILEEILKKDEKFLIERELYYITTLNPSYNIGPATDGGDTLTNHPNRESICQKMSLSNIGKVRSREAVEKVRKANTGKKRTEAVKQRMSVSKKGNKNPLYGKNLSEEHRRKISEGNTGRIVIEETREKIRKAVSGINNPWYGKFGKNHPSYGRIVKEETREKLRKVNIGKKLSQETKDKISRSHTGIKHPNYGKKASEELRKKLSLAHIGLMVGEKHPMYGKHLSEETKKKLSNFNLGKKLSSETKQKISKNSYFSKKVIINNIIYSSVAQAARELNMKRNTVCGRINSKNYPAYNFLQ